RRWRTGAPHLFGACVPPPTRRSALPELPERLGSLGHRREAVGDLLVQLDRLLTTAAILVDLRPREHRHRLDRNLAVAAFLHLRRGERGKVQLVGDSARQVHEHLIQVLALAAYLEGPEVLP